LGGDGQEHAARSTGQLKHGPPGGCGQVEVKAYVGADPARLRIHEVVQASVGVQALDHTVVPIRLTAEFSRPLEDITSLDREGGSLLLAAKIAPIQRVGWNDLFGHLRHLR